MWVSKSYSELREFSRISRILRSISSFKKFPEFFGVVGVFGIVESFVSFMSHQEFQRFFWYFRANFWKSLEIDARISKKTFSDFGNSPHLLKFIKLFATLETLHDSGNSCNSQKLWILFEILDNILINSCFYEHFR